MCHYKLWGLSWSQDYVKFLNFCQELYLTIAVLEYVCKCLHYINTFFLVLKFLSCHFCVKFAESLLPPLLSR